MNDTTRETNGQAKRKKVNDKNRQRAQPQTLTQGGHEIASLLKFEDMCIFVEGCLTFELEYILFRDVIH